MFQQSPFFLKKHSGWMNLAIEEAKKAQNQDEVPVGAVLVCGDTLIAAAHNTMHSTKNPINHAEMLVLKRGLQHFQSPLHLRNCTLYVTLEPCAMCRGAMELVGIGAVFFGAYATKAPSFTTKSIGGLCEQATKQLMIDFFKKKR